MTSPRHFAYFVALGIFWGISPSLYRYLAEIGMPVSHTICLTGLGVGLIMWLFAGAKIGSWRIENNVQRYGAICAFLMNVPFGINLYLARHLPPTELAIIISTSPIINYVLALCTGWEAATGRRLLAIAAGFSSTLLLILTRQQTSGGTTSWWLIISFAIPLLYCAYNTYAARAWPVNANILMVGAAESLWSGILIAPIAFWLAPFGSEGTPPAKSYLVILAAVLMWVIERLAYFTLIRDKGSVYTVQATYVATPAAVIIAVIFFGGAQDMWLWLSLALLMVALYFNNTGKLKQAAKPQSV